MVKAIFIVLDGLDGSGKSEIVKQLYEHLSKNENYNVMMTMEPTKGKYGREIRDILTSEIDPHKNGKKMLELFLKDREEHLKNEIIPFLNKDNGHDVNVVISDRYYYSTIVFQTIQGLDIKMLIEINNRFLTPEVTFILDIKPEVALDRIKYRDKEKFEQLKFMSKLREKFLELPMLLKDNIIIVDASRDIDAVIKEIKKEVNKLL